ncbi:MAG TPA: hypothetical protein VE974_03960 [Thermoanaerobaculia bacterium]|nr:hypothetical protein [Thermoanaerobaculia bacterium]
MLSTVLGKIETIFSKYMLLSSVYPVLIATFLNLVLLFHNSLSFRRWLKDLKPEANMESVFNLTAVAVGVAVAAFVLSTISQLLRELVEGKHWPDWLGNLAIPLQHRRKNALSTKIAQKKKERRQFRTLPEKLSDQLTEARQVGKRDHPTTCNYPASLASLEPLRVLREKGAAIGAKDLEDVAAELMAVLRENFADLPNGFANADHARRLDADVTDLEELAKYARRHVSMELIELHEHRDLVFGEQSVAPTAAGNMVNAVSSYAWRRYRFSMDLFWTRLQQVLQSDPYYATIQSAKAELDSLIALFWLIAATTVGWWIALACGTASFWSFVAVSLGGPALCAMLYSLILTSYRGFNDLLRSAVDLYRFKLLTALHLPLPEGPVEERKIWEDLSTRTAYGEETSVRYSHGAVV